MMLSKQIIIHGTVHGVGFRYFVKRHAEALFLTGYVKNRSDGAVEVVVQGSPVQVEKLIELCRHGPSGARVHDIEVTLGIPRRMSSFEIN